MKRKKHAQVKTDDSSTVKGCGTVSLYSNIWNVKIKLEVRNKGLTKQNIVTVTKKTWLVISQANNTFLFEILLFLTCVSSCGTMTLSAKCDDWVHRAYLSRKVFTQFANLLILESFMQECCDISQPKKNYYLHYGFFWIKMKWYWYDK